MALKVEHVEVLIEHGNHLLAAFDAVNKKINNGPENPFKNKELVELVKAIKDGKTMDQQRFPHLTADQVLKYGEILRYPFSVVAHYCDFQKKALKLFGDMVNESKSLDITWDYVYVIPILKLFVLYVKLHIFALKINDFNKIPIVYAYCFKKNRGSDNETAASVVQSVNNRLGSMKMLESELQILNDKFFGLFKGMISTISRLVTAGLSFEWCLINISDDPQESDPNSTDYPFFKQEYIVMLNLSLITEALVFFSLINMKVLSNDHQFYESIRNIAVLSPRLQLHGSFSVSMKEIFEDMKRIRNKKSDDLSCFEKSRDSTNAILSTRNFRMRKLTMTLQEVLNSVEADSSLLCSKLVIIMSIVGYAHFDIKACLTNWQEVSAPSVPSLIYRLVQVISRSIARTDIIRRFLVYNFREFDAPYLNSMIHSFNIPQGEYERLMKVILALNTIDIAEYDKGCTYDLSGLKMTLQRVMASFNHFSTSHGVLHLSPLFNLIAAIMFRVEAYEARDRMFLAYCPIHTYWSFIPVFTQIANDANGPHAAHTAIFLALTHFYCLDMHARAELADFQPMIEKHADSLFQAVYNAIYGWARALTATESKDNLYALNKQVSIARVVEAWDRGEDILAKPKDSEESQMKLADFPIGHESTIRYRKHLTPIFSKLCEISDTFNVLRQIGRIQVFSKSISVFEEMNKRLAEMMVTLFSDAKAEDPFKLVEQVQINNFIIQYIMTAARVDPGPIKHSCMAKLVAAPLLMNDGVASIDRDNLGHLAQVYIDFYYNFMMSGDLRQMVYAQSSQSFYAKQGVNLYASKASLRSLRSLLGPSGIACIDIMATSCIVKAMEHFFEVAKPSLDSRAFAENPFAIEKAREAIETVAHIGAICKFRQLLRQTLEPNDCAGDLAFMAQQAGTPEDVQLNALFKDRNFCNLLRDEKNTFAEYFGCLFASEYWGDAKYNARRDAFADNTHLAGLFLDCVLLAANTKKDLPPVDATAFFTSVLRAMYKGIFVGKRNVERKTVTVWSLETLTLLLDHVVISSKIADYSMLEPVVSYRMIRAIYTNILLKRF